MNENVYLNTKNPQRPFVSGVATGDSRLYEVRLIMSVSTYKIDPTEADYDEALEFVLDVISTNGDCWVLNRQQTRLALVPASEVTA